ncbi:Kef-type K+ transport system membrane protein [Streptomyces sp. NBRC 110611]|uniref:cation:proton antiporter n=1 Tax=Streptomyces sp. NBRC 110611 TaxID=1621259 RepID=UPI0008365275|nr:cation:proton antiporter [Streptomyces sp. NBRC 110611]GAU64824.1 Kef-type K+ transport system membrane protein [Streptomyces sp. NBRC 110611]
MHHSHAPAPVVVLIDLAVILLCGIALVPLCRRLRQPVIVGEIAVGILLGPSVLGQLPGDLPRLLFPDEVRPYLGVVAEIGIVFFLFAAGWELDLGALRGRGRAVVAVSASSMALALLCASVVAYAVQAIHPALPARGVHPLVFSLFVGTALSITAFSVLARVLHENGLHTTPVGTTATAAAGVGEIFAWCGVTVVIALGTGGGTGQLARTAAELAVYGLVMAFLVRPLLRRLAVRIDLVQHHSLALATVCAGLFLSASATAWIGVHAALGAFAFGVALPRLDPATQAAVAAPFQQMGAILLAAFFVVTGLSADLTTLSGLGLLSVGILLFAACAGKFAGAALAHRAFGAAWGEAGLLGVLLNCRGVTELVVLAIGRQAGLIGDKLFTMLVLIALLTTAAVAPLTRLLSARADTAPPSPPLPAPRGSRHEQSSGPATPPQSR